MKVPGIYKIQSISKPERYYIGSAINIQNRWWIHLFQLRKNKHHNPKLQRHFNKYGESDLRFSILLECPKEHLLAREQDFIDSLNPWFNICLIAGSCLGHKASEETKQKLRNREYSAETRLNMSLAKRGEPSPKKGIKTGIIPPLSFEKGHIPWNKGKTHSEETKKIMREKSLLNGNKPPSRKGQIPWNKDKIGVSKETHDKMSEAKKDKHPSAQTRQKMRDKRKLMIFSEGTRQKMREAAIRNGNKPPSRLGFRKLIKVE